MSLSRKVKFIISTIAFGLPIVVAVSWNVIFNLINKEATVTVKTLKINKESGATKYYTIDVKFNKKAKGDGKIIFNYNNSDGEPNPKSFELSYYDGKSSTSSPWGGKRLTDNPTDITLVTTKIPAYWSTGTLFISLVSIIPAPAFVIDTIKFAKERKEAKKALEHQKEDDSKANN